MRIYLAGIALIGLLSASCSSDWDQARMGTASLHAEEGSQGASSLPMATLSARGGSTSFASLPDRGELFSYAKGREVRRSGAYTSHPVEISEAHALNAIAAGGLRLTTPSGAPVNVSFDRIEEHPDGNWTWVGQSENGDHAVLTFGERAVFGEFFADGQAFRVTTRGGSAWVVETNQSLLAGKRPGHHGDGPEYLIPPSSGGSDVVLAGGKAMAAASSNVEAKSSAAVIDLAIGYTNGFVTAYGNQATAITRLTNLVALGNAAYQRSGVNMRVRLVHVLQVNFTDTSDNSDALQKLTGYNATTRQRTTPDPAFNALRTARDEYGADLVSLVRPHRSPEQKGCGIAWLLGAGQTAITATDEEFGYSVVSDGADVDEGDGNTYFCSDYSLVHELGHNMGQAHNQADSEYAGAHAYSYGYRESSSTGFHTIMAYPLANSSQTEIAYFATPLINFAAGRPMGVANASDNVRSLNQTMPVISQFRATVVPLTPRTATNHFDYNGDGLSDILWRNSINGQNVVWRSANQALPFTLATVADVDWQIVGTGDFNKDGRTDVVWRHASNGQNAIWLSGNRNTQIGVVAVTNTAWRIVGVGDFNGDGVSDLLWRNSVTGENVIWRSADRNNQQAVTGVSNLNWRVVGVGDFNGDGRSDILWRDVVNGTNSIWLSGNRDTQRGVTAEANLNWEIVGVGDFNGDGVSDILWRNQSTGANVVWRSGSSAAPLTISSAGITTRVAAIGDYNNDGKSDILWRNSSNGNNVIWLSGNSQTIQVVGAVTGAGWEVRP